MPDFKVPGPYAESRYGGGSQFMLGLGKENINPIKTLVDSAISGYATRVNIEDKLAQTANRKLQGDIYKEAIEQARIDNLTRDAANRAAIQGRLAQSSLQRAQAANIYEAVIPTAQAELKYKDLEARAKAILDLGTGAQKFGEATKVDGTGTYTPVVSGDMFGTGAPAGLEPGMVPGAPQAAQPQPGSDAISSIGSMIQNIAANQETAQQAKAFNTGYLVQENTLDSLEKENDLNSKTTKFFQDSAAARSAARDELQTFGEVDVKGVTSTIMALTKSNPLLKEYKQQGNEQGVISIANRNKQALDDIGGFENIDKYFDSREDIPEDLKQYQKQQAKEAALSSMSPSEYSEKLPEEYVSPMEAGFAPKDVSDISSFNDQLATAATGNYTNVSKSMKNVLEGDPTFLAFKVASKDGTQSVKRGSRIVGGPEAGDVTGSGGGRLAEGYVGADGTFIPFPQYPPDASGRAQHNAMRDVVDKMLPTYAKQRGYKDSAISNQQNIQQIQSQASAPVPPGTGVDKVSPQPTGAPAPSTEEPGMVPFMKDGKLLPEMKLQEFKTQAAQSGAPSIPTRDLKQVLNQGESVDLGDGVTASRPLTNVNGVPIQGRVDTITISHPQIDNGKPFPAEPVTEDTLFRTFYNEGLAINAGTSDPRAIAGIKDTVKATIANTARGRAQSAMDRRQKEMLPLNEELQKTNQAVSQSRKQYEIIKRMLEQGEVLKQLGTLGKGETLGRMFNEVASLAGVGQEDFDTFQNAITRNSAQYIIDLRSEGALSGKNTDTARELDFYSSALLDKNSNIDNLRIGMLIANRNSTIKADEIAFKASLKDRLTNKQAIDAAYNRYRDSMASTPYTIDVAKVISGDYANQTIANEQYQTPEEWIKINIPIEKQAQGGTQTRDLPLTEAPEEVEALTPLEPEPPKEVEPATITPTTTEETSTTTATTTPGVLENVMGAVSDFIGESDEEIAARKKELQQRETRSPEDKAQIEDIKNRMREQVRMGMPSIIGDIPEFMQNTVDQIFDRLTFGGSTELRKLVAEGTGKIAEWTLPAAGGDKEKIAQFTENYLKAIDDVASDRDVDSSLASAVGDIAAYSLVSTVIPGLLGAGAVGAVAGTGRVASMLSKYPRIQQAVSKFGLGLEKAVETGTKLLGGKTTTGAKIVGAQTKTGAAARVGAEFLKDLGIGTTFRLQDVGDVKGVDDILAQEAFFSVLGQGAAATITGVVGGLSGAVRDAFFGKIPERMIADTAKKHGVNLNRMSSLVEEANKEGVSVIEKFGENELRFLQDLGSTEQGKAFISENMDDILATARTRVTEAKEVAGLGGATPKEVISEKAKGAAETTLKEEVSEAVATLGEQRTKEVTKSVEKLIKQPIKDIKDQTAKILSISQKEIKGATESRLKDPLKRSISTLKTYQNKLAEAKDTIFSSFREKMPDLGSRAEQVMENLKLQTEDPERFGPISKAISTIQSTTSEFLTEAGAGPRSFNTLANLREFIAKGGEGQVRFGAAQKQAALEMLDDRINQFAKESGFEEKAFTKALKEYGNASEMSKNVDKLISIQEDIQAKLALPKPPTNLTSSVLGSGEKRKLLVSQLGEKTVNQLADSLNTIDTINKVLKGATDVDISKLPKGIKLSRALEDTINIVGKENIGETVINSTDPQILNKLNSALGAKNFGLIQESVFSHVGDVADKLPTAKTVSKISELSKDPNKTLNIMEGLGFTADQTNQIKKVLGKGTYKDIEKYLTTRVSNGAITDVYDTILKSKLPDQFKNAGFFEKWFFLAPTRSIASLMNQAALAGVKETRQRDLARLISNPYDKGLNKTFDEALKFMEGLEGPDPTKLRNIKRNIKDALRGIYIHSYARLDSKRRKETRRNKEFIAELEKLENR